MAVAGPFFLAWVDSDETTFGSEHYVMDEYVFAFRRTLSEGQKPLLELEIKNPHIGLLNPARKFWAWFSWTDGTTVHPLFFGRLVGNPVELFQEIIVIQLIAEPLDYKHQKQSLADALKVLPYYDPVFTTENQRDDPDKILEAYARFWDIDCVTHDVASVSFVDGSDGNVDLDEDDHFYDNMTTTISQPPTTVIQMDATVQWTQTARGVAGTLMHGHVGLTDPIFSAWPKSNSQIGDGWSVLNSLAINTMDADSASTKTFNASWQNESKQPHSNGDHMSWTHSWTTIRGGSITATYQTSNQWQIGYLDPYAVDEDGDPAPVNIPMTFSSSAIHVLNRGSSCSMTLQYDAARPRTERVIFRIRADTQAILVDPEVDQETETIVMNGADVGVPLLEVLNWTSVAGQAVALGQVIFPDDPQQPGGRTAQIAVVSGTAGTVPPDFSDTPGDTTVDGGVTWSSLGNANLNTYANWQSQQQYNVGAIICPSQSMVLTYAQLLAPSLKAFPPSGARVTPGLIVQASNLSYYQCVTGGVTGMEEPTFDTDYGDITADGLSVTWICLGPILPSGMDFHIATSTGISGEYPPPFSAAEGGETEDGTVTWVNLGVGGGAVIPIGGVPGQVHAPSYFTTTRGHQSLEHLALLVRARHLWRCRCVEMSFDVDWVTGLTITTRKTVTLHDPRLAGGLAQGKVKSAVLSFSDSGAAICRVTIGCLVGKDNAVSAEVGDPSYVDEGYVDEGYQQYDNVYTLLPTGSDLNYAPPIYVPSDDGLTFPLSIDSALVGRSSGGGNDSEILSSIQKSARESLGGPFSPRSFGITSPDTPSSTLSSSTAEGYWVEFELKPVNAGPFHTVINVRFSDLTMARGVNLEGAAT
jgi:hypothetical protein